MADSTAVDNRARQIHAEWLALWLTFNYCALRPKELPHTALVFMQLTYIDIGACHTLRRLPDSLGQLQALQCIKIRGCNIFEGFPDSLGDLSNLTVLQATYNFNMRTLPDTIGKLGRLEHLDLSGCDALTTLPVSLGDLTSLCSIEISGCINLACPVYGDIRYWTCIRLLSFLRVNNKSLKMLLLVVAGRQAGRKRIPPELVHMIHLQTWNTHQV